MKIHAFWKNWQAKTKQEKEYIVSLEKALQWIEKQPFHGEIISIYVKGSFVFRELNKKSDIDLVPITRNNKSLQKIREARDKLKETFFPVEILPISLQELASNQRHVPKPMQGRPDQFTLLLPYHKLIWGKTLNLKKCKAREPLQVYLHIKQAMSEKFLPAYAKNKFGFSQLIKQVFHLLYWEERIKGRHFSPSWKEIKKACPKHSLVQRTMYLRFHPTKDKRVRKKYIQEVITYFHL
jgi:hypothetical protein